MSKFKNREMRLQFFAFIFLFTALSRAQASAPEVASNVSAMYLLGDSSVDCGINTLFYPLLHRNFSLFPCNGDDASLLPHFLAEKMGIPYPEPLYTQNGSIEAITSGLNFGSAEASIMSNSLSYQSLNQQLRQVLDTIQLMRLRLGQDRARHFITSSVFYLSFGQTDFINLFLQNSTMRNGKAFARVLVSQMTIAVRNLYDADARKVICMGILPLGCTPRVMSRSPAAEHDEKGCVKEMNQLVVKYNKLMNKHILKLNAQLPEAQMVFCDAYRGVKEIISNPSSYGMEETRSACCGVGANNGSIGCVAMEIACSQDWKYVWWDFNNPTRAVNSLLADSAWSNQPFSSLCHPFTLRQLVAASPS